MRVFECPNAGSSCPFVQRSNSRKSWKVLINLARNENELIRDMFMAPVRALHPEGTPDA